MDETFSATRRQELKKKLRDKIKNKSVPPSARDIRSDPAGTLLRMGVDDANILQSVLGTKNIEKALKKNVENLKYEEEDLPPL